MAISGYRYNILYYTELKYANLKWYNLVTLSVLYIVHHVFYM